MKYFHAFALLFALFWSSPLWAVQPDEMLANPAQEARARALSKELRCMVCQNELIDESEAPLAHDLRVLVRDRIKAGDSDAQVLDFLVARYGEFVLLRPRLVVAHGGAVGIAAGLAADRCRHAVRGHPAASQSRAGIAGSGEPDAGGGGARRANCCAKTTRAVISQHPPGCLAHLTTCFSSVISSAANITNF